MQFGTYAVVVLGIQIAGSGAVWCAIRCVVMCAPSDLSGVSGGGLRSYRIGTDAEVDRPATDICERVSPSARRGT